MGHRSSVLSIPAGQLTSPQHIRLPYTAPSRGPGAGPQPRRAASGRRLTSSRTGTSFRSQRLRSSSLPSSLSFRLSPLPLPRDMAPSAAAHGGCGSARAGGAARFGAAQHSPDRLVPSRPVPAWHGPAPPATSAATSARAPPAAAAGPSAPAAGPERGRAAKHPQIASRKDGIRCLIAAYFQA